MTKEQIEALCDEVPLATRLFPARLWALQIVTGSELDEVIRSRLVDEIPALTGQEPVVRGWRLTPQTIIWRCARAPGDQTWQEHFLEDFRTFGLREAIGYLADYEFTNPREDRLIQSAVSVYRAIAQLYRRREAWIADSNDPMVRKIREALELYGEGAPQELTPGVSAAEAGRSTAPASARTPSVARSKKKRSDR